MHKAWGLVFISLLAACASGPQAPRTRVTTLREKPYYLSADAQQVQDTCPAQDIFKQYSCSKDQPNGYTCFDVYMVQGSPVNEQRYTLVHQSIEAKNVSPQPQCPQDMEPDCHAFLQALDYNLEFSWYLANFPSSAFPQCSETYDCKRIDCYLPAQQENAPSTLVSCVYKRNQRFFVGSEVTCRQMPY